MTRSVPPTWMMATPESEIRILNGVPVKGWAGYVQLEDIEYWPENRRTEAMLVRLRRVSQMTHIDDSQIYDFLKDDPGLDIRPLAEDIALNGLRTPLILDYNRVLLDGNRRYLAHRWLAEFGTPQQQDQFRRVAVWVLSEEDSDQRGRLRVITQYNFLTDFRREWSDMVKAKLLYEQYNDPKLDHSFDSLFELYGGPGFSRNKIREFIKTYDLISDYIEASQNPDDALLTVDEHFIWFQQLQRSYGKELIRNDDEFRNVIFDNIRDGSIGTTDDLKNLRVIREEIPEAWLAFKQGNISYAHYLRRVYEVNKQNRDRPDKTVSEINTRLESILNQPGMIELASQDVRDRFQDLAGRVPGQIGNVEQRVHNIISQLHAFTSDELASLPIGLVRSLDNALQQVIRQAQATKED